jgi:hypothetical protein
MDKANNYPGPYWFNLETKEELQKVWDDVTDVWKTFEEKFDELDKDGNGLIDKKEFGEAL